MSIKFIFTILLFITHLSFSQSKNVLGIAMSDSKPIPLSKIIFIDSSKNIISVSNTNFDGIFKLSLNTNLSVLHIIRKDECTITDTIWNVKLGGDTLKLDFKYLELNCEKRTYKDCPKQNENCDIYRSCNIFYDPYDKIEKDLKNEKSQKIELLMRKPVYYENQSCCIKTWYCKTHDIDF